jgi:hypothetical protein
MAIVLVMLVVMVLEMLHAFWDLCQRTDLGETYEFLCATGRQDPNGLSELAIDAVDVFTYCIYLIIDAQESGSSFEKLDRQSHLSEFEMLQLGAQFAIESLVGMRRMSEGLRRAREWQSIRRV